jgi:hypothetical protein
MLIVGPEPGRANNNTQANAGSGSPIGAFSEESPVRVYRTSTFTGDVGDGDGSDPADVVRFEVGDATDRIACAFTFEAYAWEDFAADGWTGAIQGVSVSIRSGAIAERITLAAKVGHGNPEFGEWSAALNSAERARIDNFLTLRSLFLSSGGLTIAEEVHWNGLGETYTRLGAAFERWGEALKTSEIGAVESEAIADVEEELRNLRSLENSVSSRVAPYRDAIEEIGETYLTFFEEFREPVYTLNGSVIDFVRDDRVTLLGDTLQCYVELSDPGYALVAKVTGRSFVFNLEPGAPSDWLPVEYGFGLETLAYTLPKLIGTLKNDRISGTGNDDRIDGKQGDDLINGKAGDDHIVGGHGNDTIDGGVGDDWVDGSFGNDVIRGGTGNDTLAGSFGNDRIDGGDGNDSLHGGEGNDRLGAGKGNDRLDARAGQDILRGGIGRDVLIGGTENDTLSGGVGPDRFVFFRGDGLDIVTDFTPGEDDLDLTGAAPIKRISADGNDTVILLGRDQIVLTGVAPSDLSDGDFLV